MNNSNYSAEIEITGCINCPFSYENDMAVGYGCKLEKSHQSIRQSKTYLPITPNWCPIKTKPVVVKYQENARQ